MEERQVGGYARIEEPEWRGEGSLLAPVFKISHITRGLAMLL